MFFINFEPKNLEPGQVIACPSFSSELEYEIYIYSGQLRCTCPSFKFNHSKKGTFCKHIKLLAETILDKK